MSVLTLAMIVALSASHASPTQYQLRIDVIRGADTVRTNFRIEEGLEGRALVEGPKSFTRVQATVRRGATDGCVRVTVASASATDKAAVERMKVEPAPLLEVCGATTGEIALDGVHYRVTVREAAASEHAP